VLHNFAKSNDFNRGIYMWGSFNFSKALYA
jgi:hypothetical protein